MAQKYGYQANGVLAETTACVVCDTEKPVFSWTDANGEGYCTRCGTPYQLANGTLHEGESYPRCNVKAEWVPVMRRYFAETGRGTGSGSFFIWDDYPDQRDDRHAFNNWLDAHPDALPA